MKAPIKVVCVCGCKRTRLICRKSLIDPIPPMFFNNECRIRHNANIRIGNKNDDILLRIATLNPAKLIGNRIDKKCPTCSAQLRRNKLGDEWCSHIYCNYGCEDLYQELGLT